MEDLTLEELEQRQIDGVEVSPYDVRLLVLSYLLHHCYVDTAQAFIEACNLQEEGKRLCIAVQQRKGVPGSLSLPPSLSPSPHPLLLFRYFESCANGQNRRGHRPHPLGFPTTVEQKS